MLFKNLILWWKCRKEKEECNLIKTKKKECFDSRVEVLVNISFLLLSQQKEFCVRKRVMKNDYGARGWDGKKYSFFPKCSNGDNVFFFLLFLVF